MAITNGYATLAEVKSALRIIDNQDDSLLEMAIESASRLLDSYTARSFYNAGTASRYFVAANDYRTDLDDAISITEVATDFSADGSYDTIWSATDYELLPLNGRVDGLPVPYNAIKVAAGGDYTFPVYNGEGLVKVTGTWGWASIPIAIKQATIIQASRIFKRLDSPLGVLSSPDLGFIRVGSRLDPDVAQLVDPYRIVKFA
jgi:hypothetical protein